MSLAGARPTAKIQPPTEDRDPESLTRGLPDDLRDQQAIENTRSGVQGGGGPSD